ncbi:entericidin A/B family lipoprotein [Paracoccus sp. P2]|uniref:Entericidin A/B family lipoprotein n=1 Tax=Paracoccus pantotrophus TaxID=82367 RepID=A0A1I5JC08_PARPN|nr:entericidin A/B family lipoprotein [Paracoccus pantotrophus]MDF3855345.1 entericidin A/B family lipoprotein [Paracoccus pantotrophus]QFG35877.1 entericidin A/B family lipoprotein [Paracoccus pantotrophus]QLH12751.1 entericidin A/B family lipoprotein [Paracoccus pantotrophus]RDD96399.1 entericidin, EcnA/B family [Paracoccus pantotrophus]RKS43863.1 putative small secreted protein [Paracoccus pantotrophus]
MRKIIHVSPLLALLALAACQTVQGAGRDLQSAGQAISRESQEAQAGM